MLRALALLVLLANLALLLWGSSRPPPAHTLAEPPALPAGVARLLLLEESERRVPIPRPAPSVESSPSCLRLEVAEDRPVAEALAAELTTLGHTVDWVDADEMSVVMEIRPGPAGEEAWSEEVLVALIREAGLEPSECLHQPIAPPTTIP